MQDHRHRSRRAGKLLAVVTIAAASPAFANPSAEAKPRVAVAPVVAEPMPAPRGPAPPRVPLVVKHVVSSFAIARDAAATPRQLPNGTPACGNVGGKAPRRRC